MPDTTYKIIRYYRDFDHPDHGKVVNTGFTLEQAKTHCKDEATHELDSDGVAIWFDGYEEE